MANRTYTQTFGVIAALIERDGKFLLVRENRTQHQTYDHGKWNHPAGWIEVGENPLDGIKREVIEETGHEFSPSGILGIYSVVRDLRTVDGNIHHPIKIAFIGDVSDQPVADIHDDVSEIRWFSPEEIFAMDEQTLRDADIKTMVRDYLDGKKFPLSVTTHTIQGN